MLKKYSLKNGVRVVCEKLQSVRSVSVGIWVGTGSRNEAAKLNGISHFIEHMLFKGTSKRNAAQIAEAIDNIGGQLNAFTGKECTCFYAKTLDEHIAIALDVLSDMFFNSVFASRDIALEKRVIIEEIGMYEDSPEDLVHDVLSETVWGGSPVGYPILGTKKSLRNINRDRITEYMRERYTPYNTVISVAGNFDDAQLAELLEKYFGSWEHGAFQEESQDNTVFKADVAIREKDIEQVHICIGFEGVKNGDDALYPLMTVNNILGGGMSSRLFQRIREKKGLVYSIYSYPTTYRDTGLFTIYAGMNPGNLGEVMHLIYDEIRIMKKKGITKEDLEKAKEQMKGSYILGLESTSSRMNSIGKSELLLGYINTPEEILEKINAVKMEDVDAMISRIFDLDRKGISIVGNVKDSLDQNVIS